MVTVCCCQCDPRLACYGVSILSFFHFMIESALLYALDDEHRLVDEDKGLKFLTVFVTNLSLVFSSLLLFFAAFYLIRWLCIPWLIGCAFHLLIYIAILVVIILRILEGFAIAEVEKFLFTLFQIFSIIYAMWLVTSFMVELEENGSDSKSKLRAKKSLFTLYSEPEAEEEDEEELFPKQSKSRSKKTRKGRGGNGKNDKEPLIR